MCRRWDGQRRVERGAGEERKRSRAERNNKLQHWRLDYYYSLKNESASFGGSNSRASERASERRERGGIGRRRVGEERREEGE